VDGRLLSEQRCEVHRGELLRVERPGALAENVGAGEGLWHCHLLVDREANEQCERIFREQLAGGWIVGEVKCCGHAAILRHSASSHVWRQPSWREC